jgi:uncharacterized protein
VQVIWHAGEPTTLPCSYYEQAFEIISRIAGDRVRVSHGLSSNATLIDDEWCDFFHRHDVLVGLSIDGPAEIHDRNRLTRSGKGTFSNSIKGLRRMKERGIPFYVLSVLTRDSLSRADEIYAFYKSEGVTRVAFNVEEIEGPHQRSTLQAEGVQAEFEAFLRRFWNLVLEDGGRIRVREFDQMMRDLVKNPDAPVVRSQTEPFVHLTVDWQGNFSTFSPELIGHPSEAFNDFVLGNLCAGSLMDAVETPVFQRLRTEIAQGVSNCRQSCEYFDVCGGGAPGNKYWETGSFASTETMFCRLMKKAVANVTLDILDSLAAAGGEIGRMDERGAGDILEEFA